MSIVDDNAPCEDMDQYARDNLIKCKTTIEVDPGVVLLGPILGPGLRQGTAVVHCDLDSGHDGEHRGAVVPFPGFASEVVRWVTEEQRATRNWDREIEKAYGSPGSDWFTGHLLRLIAKADLENRERIRAGFPEAVAAYERWHTGVGG